jgi:D-alanyl-D-alanine carboxypeptidase
MRELRVYTQLLTGATGLKRKIAGERSAVVVGALTLFAALSLFLSACGHNSETPVRTADGMFVMDDFESGAIADWKALGSGSGGWFVYSNGSRAPDPAHSDPNVPFDLPDPPQGKSAVVSDMSGPGTLILYRDVKLDGRLMLHLTVFHSEASGFSSPHTLDYDEPEDNQQFRIDLVAPSAPIDSLARGDILVNVFKTSTREPYERQPTAVKVNVSRWAGQTVRLRLAVTDNRGPLRAGVDNIRFEPIGSDADARIELPDTKEASSALNLLVHGLTETDALKALSTHAQKLAAEGDFSGAVLVTKDDHVLFGRAYGLANRTRGIPNTLQTRFRIGSMNKMFTAVAVVQLAQAGKIKLSDPLGKYLSDYPNKELTSKVTIHHLLTHTGGTGDFFGPEFDKHRLELRTLQDYVKLYGQRGVEFEPGSKWAYSNYGFLLLGVLIEKVSGQSYYDYVAEHVYKPAGMTLTASLAEDQLVPGRSVGYTRFREQPGPGDVAAPDVWRPNTDTLPYRGTSAGGGYSTVEDLLRFAKAVESKKLLDAEHTELLTTGKVETGGGGKYAYGFGDRSIGGIRCFGHGGGAPGMNGDLEICPGPGYVVAVLANLDPPAAQRVSDFVLNRLPEK